MNTSTFVVLLTVLIVMMFFYSQHRLKNRIHCTFRRANKTKIEKLVSTKSRHVVFDGGRYIVDPTRISLLWYNKGVNAFFPQWIPSLDYSWDSEVAHDPQSFRNTWDTPEAREAAQQEESWVAFSKGVQTQTGTKSKFPAWLFPAITLGAVVLLGFWIYQMGQHISIIEQVLTKPALTP